MSIVKIAIKNIQKSLSFYALYLFSIMLILMIYFAFESFSVNNVILEKISEDGRVETMIGTISVFLMAFVLFFMSYSNNFFMRRRMKELGIYTLLGYRKSTMLKLFMIENIIICIGAYVCGAFLGALFHKGIVAFVIALLGLGINQAEIPLFNLSAIKSSLRFVILVIIILSASNWNFLHKKTVLNLVRLEKKQEKELKVRFLPAAIGMVLVAAGDFLLLDAMKKKDSIWHTIGVAPIGLITIISITIGTILAVYSLLPFICRILERKEKILYKPFAIVSIPKFIYRIRSNAKTLIMLSLLSAGTLGLFGVSILSAYYPIVSLERIIPSAIEFRYDEEEDIAKVEAVLQSYNIKDYSLHSTRLLLVKAESREGLPNEYDISQDRGREPGFELMRYSDYEQLLEQQGREINMEAPDNGECVLVKYRKDEEKQDIGKTFYLMQGTEDKIPLKIVETTLDNVIGFANSIGTLIVADSDFNKLQIRSPENINIVSVNGKELRENKEVAVSLQEIFEDNIYFSSAYLRNYEIIYENSSTFLLLGFLTVLFFIASGSILHFHNTSAILYDKDEYRILSKMGYSGKKIKSIIRSQVRIIYLIPFIIGLIHAICGLVCYSALLMDDVLGKGNRMILPAGAALMISGIIFFVYYLITKSSCYRTIMQK